MKILFLFFLLLYPQQGWSKAQCPAGLTQQECCDRDPRGATLTSCDNSCGTCTGGYYAGCFKCTGASHDMSLECNDGYEYNSSSKSCVKSTKSSYDIYYRDTVWTSNTQKNSAPVQASSLSEAASAIQRAWAPRYATCSGNSSTNTVSCACDTGKAGVQYFWIGSNCLTFASSRPGVCYKAGTYYQTASVSAISSPGNDCAIAYKECPADCASCAFSNGSIQCSSCKAGYYKDANGDCVAACPAGYVQGSNNECVEAEEPDPMAGACPSPLKKSADGCCCVK